MKKLTRGKDGKLYNGKGSKGGLALSAPAITSMKPVPPKVVETSPVSLKPYPALDMYEIESRRLASEQAAALRFPIEESALTESEKEKIASNALRIGVSYEEVLQSVLTDKIAYLNVVSKSPSRQNYQEKLLAGYLLKNKAVKKIEKLPTSGQHALYIINGEVRSMADGLTYDQISKASVKSLDFKIELHDGKIGYVTAKHTKDDGGSQANQMKDVVLTLKQFYRKEQDKDYFLVANIDGEHYTKKRKNYGNKNYIEYLTGIFKSDKIVITNYINFSEDIKRIKY